MNWNVGDRLVGGEKGRAFVGLRLTSMDGLEVDVVRHRPGLSGNGYLRGQLHGSVLPVWGRRFNPKCLVPGGTFVGNRHDEVRVSTRGLAGVGPARSERSPQLTE